MTNIFGTDGIRGEFGSEHISPEAFYYMGATLALSAPEISDFVIGHDSRVTGNALAQAAAAGVKAAFGNPILTDVASTPAIAHLSRIYGGGVSVTASHNQEGDNGFKAFILGDKLDDGRVEAFEDQYLRLRTNGQARPVKITDYEPSAPRMYTSSLKKVFEEGSLVGKSIVLDCANGACSETAPEFFKDHLGASVIELATDRYGRINDGVGATHPEALQKIVGSVDSPYDSSFIGGFAFDGDGDRVIGVSSAGNLVNGNHWLSILADGEEGVVGTLYTNNALRESLQLRGVEFHECDNGDKNVTKRLSELGLTRGGEFTGHLIDTEHLSSGDGLYMAALMATTLAKEEATLEDVFQSLPLWPEKMEILPMSPHQLEQLNDDEIAEIVDQQLGRGLLDDTSVVVRKSGTEPILRIWAQSRSEKAVAQTIEKLRRGFHYYEQLA